MIQVVQSADGHLVQVPVGCAAQVPAGRIERAVNDIRGFSHSVSQQTQQAPPTSTYDQLEDSDVTAEHMRVQQNDVTALMDSEAVVMRGLCKTYGRLVAVDTLNLAVGQGQYSLCTK